MKREAIHFILYKWVLIVVVSLIPFLGMAQAEPEDKLVVSSALYHQNGVYNLQARDTIVAGDGTGSVVVEGDGTNGASLTYTAGSAIILGPGFTAKAGSRVTIRIATWTTPQLNGQFLQGAQYNGNISAVKWKTYHDNQDQAYSFDYDALSRLKNAQFATYDGTAWGNMGAQSTEMSYDRNGNIMSLLRQQELDYVREIDDLTYTYGAGNQLTSVDDGTNRQEGFSDGDNSGADYTYDANGNMTTDENKDISTIEYNHLNLPKVVHFENGDRIEYIYDAAGIKLAQKVIRSGETIPETDRVYAGEFIYENDDLELINHEEGRVMPKRNLTTQVIEGYEYQYHLKDHLGNVRTTMTTEPGELVYTATMESDDANVAAFEESFFLNIAETRGNSRPLANTTPGGDESAELNVNQPIGPSLALKVHRGDEIVMTVDTMYELANGYNATAGITSLARMVINSLANIPGTGEGAGAVLGDISNALAGTAFAGGSQTNDDSPAAFLNFLVFDEDFEYLPAQSGFNKVPAAAPNMHHQLGHTLNVDENGYVVIYLSNESQDPYRYVYFDQLEVTHTFSPVVQVDDYYPFGLTFNSYTRSYSTPNKFKYNGKELQEETGLYDYGARYFDPAIARFINIDPASDNYQSWTPYHYVMNNPIKFVDPTGMFTELFNENGKKIGEDENGADGNVAIVTDKKEVKRVKANTKNGTHTESSSLSSTVNLPSAGVREAMGICGR